MNPNPLPGRLENVVSMIAVVAMFVIQVVGLLALYSFVVYGLPYLLWMIAH